MDKNTISEVFGVLRNDRIPFPYFRDRYAFRRLAACAGERGRSVSELRASGVGSLLQKPTVREVLARGRSVITSEDFSVWPDDCERYELTFGSWGADEGWSRSSHQKSRRGFDLVLQLNFDARHDALFHALDEYFWDDDLNLGGHPVNRRGRRTLGWARIDFDDASGEALIEEVQSDWIATADWYLEDADDFSFGKDGRKFVEIGHRRLQGREVLARYTDEIARHRRIWSEAVLDAALQVVEREFRSRIVYFHTPESGHRFKGFRPGWCRPPRSLYTELPRRFGFERTNDAPTFLKNDADGFTRYLANRVRPEFWRMETGERWRWQGSGA